MLGHLFSHAQSGPSRLSSSTTQRTSDSFSVTSFSRRSSSSRTCGVGDVSSRSKSAAVFSGKAGARSITTLAICSLPFTLSLAAT